MSVASRAAWYALYSALVAAISWAPLEALVRHSQRDNTASHVVLIPLISIGLVLMERRKVFTSVSTSWRAGGALVAVGLALMATTRLAWPAGQVSLTVATAPVVLMWAAGFVWMFGTAAARAALFPLLFLAFTVPFPEPMLKIANDFLKDGSTEVVAGLFQVTGTPYYREAYVFRLPTVAIEVADACSGIRSSIGLLLTSLLAGYMFLERVRNRALLLLAIVPITIFKNGVRIVTLSLLTIHVDPGYLDGQLHHEGGVVFFVISLGLLMPVLMVLGASERRRGGNAATAVGHVRATEVTS